MLLFLLQRLEGLVELVVGLVELDLEAVHLLAIVTDVTVGLVGHTVRFFRLLLKSNRKKKELLVSFIPFSMLGKFYMCPGVVFGNFFSID